VLIDKPITTTLLEALELANLAKTQKRLLCAFQNRRWDSDYLTLLKLISDDRLGDIIDFESQWVYCSLSLIFLSNFYLALTDMLLN
jgi:scyllo-inositol 2-dehydrogenase (NADP+)